MKKAHWIAHILLIAAVGILLGGISGGYFGYQIRGYVDRGHSAGRPGVALEPAGVSGGLGGAANPNILAHGEGSGVDWCAVHSGYPLGASFQGVYACGPADGAPGPFDTVGYQCVEYSVRFAYARYGIYLRGVPTGSELVEIGHVEYGIPVGTPAKHRLPLPGDIVSLSGGAYADPNGHTAVVTADRVDRNGNGIVDIAEQNGTLNGWDELDVSHWAITYGSPSYEGGSYYYTHVSWLELVRQSKPKPPKAPHGWFRWERSIPYLNHGHLTAFARFASSHPWVGDPTSRAQFFSRTRHRRHAYEQQRFRSLRGGYRWQLTRWPGILQWGIKVRRI